MKTILIPYECGAGATAPGAENGPRALFDAGLAGRLGAFWLREPGVHTPFMERGFEARRAVVLEKAARIRADVEGVVKAGDFPLTVAGDHSIAAGSIRGFAEGKNAHGKIGVLWVDAHADMNTPETTVSGSYHGMPVAALLGLGDAAYCGPKAVLRPEHVCILGGRDIDPPEVALIERLGVRMIGMDEIAAKGLQACMAEALAHISKGADYKVMSFDTDSLWPADFTLATGTPVPGGIDPDAMLAALKTLPRGCFDMIELVEVNPALGNISRTAELAIKLLEAAVL